MDLKVFVNSDWSSGSNLLQLAVKSKNIDLVKNVLQYGVDINHLNSSGETALFHTCGISRASSSRAEENKILKLLLDEGIDPNIKKNRNGETILFFQFTREAVKILLDRGADPNITNKNSSNAMSIYCKFLYGSNHDDFLKIIYELLPVTNLDNNNGESLRILIQRKSTELDLLHSMISRMKKLDYVDKDGNSFLHHAAKNQDYWSVIKLLIELGVDLNIENKDGKDFYDLCYKNVQKIIKSNYPEFMEFRELRSAASKYNL